ncbi:MAG TPA: hypothetical protein VKK79_12745, partial [Candidatus Lokiarchaeia archaeon]|nr:hypothetical protein [Candidatus Lokiarchaeia archaeon]
QMLYAHWVDSFVSGVWPYSPALAGYPYPPLFIVTLAGFDLLPGPQWKMAIPLFACTIATGYLLFKIAYKLTGNERRATTIMLLYYINPFTLLYGSFGWLNPSLFVFFVVLAFYLALLRKDGWAIVSLGIATMYKQLAVVFLPLLVLAFLKDLPSPSLGNRFKNLLKSTGIYILSILAISAPFLAVKGSVYLQQAFLGQIGYSIELLTSPTQITWPVTFNTFFVWVGAPAVVTIGIAYCLQYYILLGGCAIVIFFNFSRLRAPEMTSVPKSRNSFLVTELLFAALVLVFCLQLFFPHGSYKYYLMLLTPFISLFYDFDNLSLTPLAESPKDALFRWQSLAPVLLSWIIFLFDRNIYFLILLAWLLVYLQKKRKKWPKIALHAEGQKISVDDGSFNE